jgi:hypothetical protein
VREWLLKLLQTGGKYARPYCKSCKLIWGRESIGRIFTCTSCSRPLRLKCFNPWLKALCGLFVITGGTATLLIPNVPVLWLGGFIWGGSLVFSGFRQWSKIRALDRSDTGQLGIVDEIISCPNCGTRNRIRTHSGRMRPVCGKRHRPLPEQRGPGVSLPTLLSLLREHRKPIMGTAALALLGLLLWTLNKPRQPANATTSTEAAPPPPSQQVLTPLSVPESAQSSQPAGSSSEDDETAPARSLPTGTMFTTPRLTGKGELTLENGTDLDAVVTVVDTSIDLAIASFYIRTGQNNTLTGVPNGSFAVLYELGRDWDSASQAFTRRRSCGRYDKLMRFSTETRVEGDWINRYYDTHTLTLHKVPGGNVTTSQISEAEFKKYLAQTGAMQPQ